VKTGQGAVAGITSKASNALVTRCHFADHGWCAIDLCMRLVWQEGYAPHRVLIRDNDFATRHPISSNCGYPGGRSEIGPAYIHHIRVEGNRFVGAEAWCLRLNNIRQVTIDGNRLSGPEAVAVGTAVGALLGRQAPARDLAPTVQAASPGR
jgi:hypothetical protein